MEFNMKKKLIVATAIVLLLAMSMTLLVGCDEIFKKNDKRDAQQVVASVTYTGDSARKRKTCISSSLRPVSTVMPFIMPNITA